jgi:putative nucleotidyltransferase with HDIG domain
MPIFQALDSLVAKTTNAAAPHATGAELNDMLERAYGVPFAILDGQSGNVLYAPASRPICDWSLRAEVCREVARRGRPEFIDDEDPLLTLALPIEAAKGVALVAVATFLTRRVDRNENLSQQAKLLGMNAEEVLVWADLQTPWTAESLQRLGIVVLDSIQTKRHASELQAEANDLSTNLSSTYEEISLLYRLTQNLTLSKSDAELGHMALEWLQEVVPATGLAILLTPLPGAEKSLSHAARSQPLLLSFGDCPLDEPQFFEMIAHLGPELRQRPIVANRLATSQPDWPYPQIHQMVAVTLAEGENVFGWLVAMNHAKEGEFGTVEASLLGSVAAILGIHSGNIDLYRQQSDLLTGVVRALTSAIDAKDRYTRGHSDRVARIAVRLAEELGCDSKMLNTLYLAGLLHDIGKIGVDDRVLRKAGKLSDEEYEHIKQHPEVGYRILHDLVKLEDVLPVVLHHHESWDGGGYPRGLDLEHIPLAARIVAVADAFDAMSSDRPYRRGMPEDKVDQILRAGAGQQWDPQVVAALFNVRDDIRRICEEETRAVEAAKSEAM